MAKKLTRKQKGFIKDYLATGNGSLSVKKNYDVTTDLAARSIASENLTKPHIIKAIESIADSIPDSLLVQRHLELLNKRERKTYYEGKDENGESIYHAVDEVDAPAVKAGLELAYKIKGTFAPERSIVGHLILNGDKRNRAKGVIGRFLTGGTSK